MKQLKELILLILVFSIIVLIGIVCNKLCKTESPITYTTIDSIKYKKDSLIIEINNLDSIKDAQVIEVRSLDNDSTLKLFYKLVKE